VGGYPSPTGGLGVGGYPAGMGGGGMNVSYGEGYDEMNLARRPRDWRADYNARQGISSYLPRVGRSRSDVQGEFGSLLFWAFVCLVLDLLFPLSTFPFFVFFWVFPFLIRIFFLFLLSSNICA